ncbi:NAD-dependent epimerase/dehydratase family protein [Candidatus Gracilibacteria bacterium]|nr:NAD-dependent epimerase/dehydratase family protein [Candidatus Gracilibacteria bacterium]
MRKILIIGSKGFIGTKAMNYFASQKDVKIYGCDVVVDYESENYFLIDSSTSFDKIFRSELFDVCINCSGAASVPDSIKNPMRDFELNTHNVFKILNAIKDYNPQCKFVNLSSAAVYGNPEELPIRENQTLNPVSPYGRHKLMAEIICKEFSDHFDISTVSLRIFSAYGEGLKKQLFWDLYKKVVQNKEISLFGTGEESRDFIHVDDLIQTIALVILHAGFKGEAINIANGEEIYINDAVRLFYQNFSESIDFVFSGSERKGDPSNWVADISLIRSFGYKQTVDFEQGLERYYKWAERKG